MRVLVTGSTSSIGASLVQHLEARHEVFTLDRWRQGRAEDDRHYLGDLLDFGAVAEAVERASPDVVVHLAANASISYALNHPTEVMLVNGAGTAALVRACERYVPKLRAFLLASSSEVYGAQSSFPLRENTPLNPTTAYAASKIAAEHLVKASRLPYVILRNYNTYGRANVGSHQLVTDKFIVKALRGEPIAAMGDTTRRDFLFREDHVGAYLSVLNSLDEALGETFQFATGRAVTMEELALIVRSAASTEVEIQPIEHQRADGMRMVCGSYSKAKASLGWEPQYTLEEGIHKAVEEWYAVLPEP